MSKFYITTPIYYVNSKPHIGHSYTTLTADVLTRFLRLQKKDVFFLTGTDEHGAKIAEAAEKTGKNPKEFCDENSELFKKTWENLGIEYDYFIRTTDRRHEEAVKKFVEKLQKNGFVYKKEYEGLYCRGCEKFLTGKELTNGICAEHKIKPEKISEKNYFFKLRDYLEEIKNLIKKNQLKIEPAGAKKEVLGLLNQKIEDFSISRQQVKWGIVLPFDQNQTVYVWIDALLNYISAIGYGDNPAEFKKWWKNSRVIHFLGKDILKFHAIFWPALLLAAGEKIPNQEFIHGFLTVNGQKMSKTLGNVIDPNELVKKFGAEATRYLLLSQFPFGQDGDIKEEKFAEKYNSDLADGLGNLTARVLTLAVKYDLLNKKNKADKKIVKIAEKTRKNCKRYMEDVKFYEALKEIWKLIAFCDKYINENKPWQLAETNNKKLEKILSDLLYGISEISDLIAPFLPKTSQKIKNQIKSGGLEILFPKFC